MLTDKYFLLKKHWGYDSFLPNQEKVIDSILDHRDTVALMPTGGGKSLCYQVPALLMPGLCIVISPLIALMTDQVGRLEKAGIKAATINSGISRQEQKQILQSAIEGQLKLLYISPEKLQQRSFLDILSTLKISFIAVDEAHCISQWGYDFRPEYRKISAVKDIFPGIKFAAFTATANSRTLKDIVRYLDLKTPFVLKAGFLKKNLRFGVIKTEKKLDTLFILLRQISGSGIIYLRSRKGAEKLTAILKQKGFNAGYYHAGMSTDTRKRKQTEWLYDKIQIIVSTTAFGMGIDKPSVRKVIHFGLPSSMEEYYQEAGRAGRDGNFSDAIIIYSDKDIAGLEEELNDFPSFYNIKTTFKNFLKYYNINDNAPVTVAKPVDDFIYDNSLSPKQTLRALQELEHWGNIFFSTTLSYRHSLIRIIIEPEKLNEITTSYKDFSDILKVIIYKYEDAFDRKVALSEKALAESLHLDTTTVISKLDDMHNKKIIDYENKIKDFYFTVLKTDLNPDKKELKFRRKRLKHNIQSIKHYLQFKQCRQKNILKYFEENLDKNCGVCDNCMGVGDACFSDEDIKRISKKLSYFDKYISIEDMLYTGGYIKRNKNLNIIRQFLQQGKLKIENDKIRIIKRT